MAQLAGALSPEGVPYREHLLIALSAAAISYLGTGVVRKFAIRAQAVAIPRDRDVHVAIKPRLGGLGIFAGVLWAVFVAYHLPVLSRAFSYSQETLGVLIASVVIVGIGAMDDRYGIGALTKLAGQMTAAGILVYFNVKWTTLWIPWGSVGDGVGSRLVLGPDQSAIVTVFLCVAIINAVNFIDGLDGLAAGVGLIAASAICVFSMVLIAQSGGEVTNYPPALIAATLAGACAGFLPHNFSPSRIFMGDSGSMLIGLLLTAAITSAAGRVNDANSHAGSVLALLAPLIVSVAVIFVPVLDLAMAVVRRSRAGTSPFAPDKMHLHHRLLRMGHSQRRVVLLIYLWVAITAFGAIGLATLNTLLMVVLILVAIGLAVAATVLPSLAYRRSRHVPS